MIFLNRMRSKNKPSDNILQLWIHNLGSHPDDVVAWIAEEQELGGEASSLIEVYGETPSLYLELPEGSDTFSLIHLHANELSKRGAEVEVKQTKT